MLSSFGCVSSPSGPNASSSKKHHVLDPLARNSPLEMRSCSLVVNTDAFLARLPCVDDLQGPGPESPARIDRHEAGQDEEPVALYASTCSVLEHAAIVLPPM